MNLNHPRFTPLIHLVQRAYSNLCRSRRIQLATISTLAAIGGLIYALSVMQLQQQRSLLGDYIMVRLAATDIAIGEPITLGNTHEFTSLRNLFCHQRSHRCPMYSRQHH
jgi:hypothetical protein